jgi:hypothetical protein
MSTELKVTPLEQQAIEAASESSGLGGLGGLGGLARVPSEAERRVQLAKQRLQHHLAVLDHRARNLAKQSAWIAGMVLLGLVGAAAAASAFRPKKRRSHYYAEPSGRPLGPALMLAAFGLLARGARSLASRRT